MESHCLNHQGIVATHRCVSCLKPLCSNCIQQFAEGVFCSTECHEQAESAAERAVQIAQSDADLKAWKQKQFAIKMVVTLVIGGGLYFGWDVLPSALTDNLEKFWDLIVSFVKKGFPGK